MRLRHLTIGKKLTVIMMVTSTTALLLVGTSFMGFSFYGHRSESVRDLKSLADGIGRTCQVALQFDVPEDVEDMLSAFAARPSVVKACIYDREDQRIAVYPADGSAIRVYPLQPRGNSHAFRAGSAHIFQEIKLNNEVIGTLYLQDDLRDVQTALRQDSVVLAAVISLALVIAYVMSSQLQKLVSGPILSLARTAATVTEQNDYSIRAEKRNEDEVGHLIDSFNRMLSEIQRRDSILREKEYIIDSASSAIGTADLAGNMTYVNPSFCEMWGFNAKEVLGRPFKEYWLVGDSFGEVVQTTQGKSTFSGEIQARRKDGTLFDVQISAATVYDNQGRPVSFMASSIDITERMQAEEETSRLRNYLKNIIDSMPSVLIGLDAEGRVTQWNRQAEEITGISVAEAQHCLLAQVFPRLNVEMARIQRAIRERQMQKYTKVAHESAGTAEYWDVTVYPLVTDGVEGAVVRVDDVTKQVRLEEMMIQSEKMLSVGGLAAGMAHEINNPLAGIIQNTQLMRNRLSADLEKNREAAQACGVTLDAIKSYMTQRGVFDSLATIQDAGQRAAKIVDNMLSFSRKSESRFEPHDLAELLDKTVELASSEYDLEKKYDFRQIEIVREYDPSVPQISCEYSKIQQVFLNILKNGTQAMADMREEGRSPCFVLRVLREGNGVRIEIEDNGPGMDDNTRKRVFEPFFTTKTVSGGTGLGLSVSYFIVTEDHQGSMAVESRLGAGSKFIIGLPLSRHPNQIPNHT